MSTNAVIGSMSRIDEGFFYVHWDGYPSAVIPYLRKIIQRDGAKQAMHTLSMWSGMGGWSILSTERIENTLGSRAKLVPGYGVAYRDVEDATNYTLEEAEADLGIEYLYLVIDTTKKPIIVEMDMSSGPETVVTCYHIDPNEDEADAA